MGGSSSSSSSAAATVIAAASLRCVGTRQKSLHEILTYRKCRKTRRRYRGGAERTDIGEGGKRGNTNACEC